MDWHFSSFRLLRGLEKSLVTNSERSGLPHLLRIPSACPRRSRGGSRRATWRGVADSRQDTASAVSKYSTYLAILQGSSVIQVPKFTSTPPHVALITSSFSGGA